MRTLMHAHVPHWLSISLGVLCVTSTLAFYHVSYGSEQSFSATEHGFENPPEDQADISDYADWVRPEGPLRVALQAGHWQATNVPEELAVIRKNGAYAAGYWEWYVNLMIAHEAKRIIDGWGLNIDVEILPATVPPAYYADVFIAIHADDSTSSRTSGYKVASPWRDWSGRSEELAMLLQDVYGEATGLPLDGNVTRNMRGYYAFNWRRYRHAMHPMTNAAILETGFLSSPVDRSTIVQRPDVPAQAIADTVAAFLSLSVPHTATAPARIDN